MKKNYEVAIVGGGASGLMLAKILSDSDKFNGKKQIVLFERNDRVGKKLALTGNGQGNITNLKISPSNFHSENEGFSNSAINFFDNESLIDYFKNKGVKTSSVNEKVYLNSKRATDIVDILRENLDFSVDLMLSSFVTSAKKENGLFIIDAGGEKFYAKTLILSAGGKSYSRLGADGNGYLLAKSFGHKITKLFPSLVQLKTETASIKNLRGIKTDVKIVAKSEGVIIMESEGELLFTEYGVSGPAIFALSGISCFSNVVLEIDFLSENDGELENMLKKRVISSPNAPLEELFLGTLNKQICKAVLTKNNFNLTKSKISDISRKEKEIINAFKKFKLKVTGNLGFDNAQVTKGGIDTKEVSPKTLKSNIVDNLYFTGEILDVDGDCGGYNLQWAFSSAQVVANEILKR